MDSTPCSSSSNSGNSFACNCIGCKDSERKYSGSDSGRACMPFATDASDEVSEDGDEAYSTPLVSKSCPVLYAGGFGWFSDSIEDEN